MKTIFTDEPNKKERAKDKALEKIYNPFKQFNIRFTGHEISFENIISDYAENSVKEDIQKTFQEYFSNEKKRQELREERVKIFLCELYGWDKDHVEVEEVGKNLYSAKTYCDYYLFEMRVEEKE